MTRLPTALLLALALAACNAAEAPAPALRPFPDSLRHGTPAGAADREVEPAGAAAVRPPDAAELQPPPPGVPWTVGVVDRPSEVEGSALVRAVRAAPHPDAAEPYDRVVFEVAGDAPPGVHVEYVDSPVRACGSGDVVPLPGDNQLLVRLSPAQGHTDAGQPTVPTALPAFGDVLAVRRTCDFEGEVTYVLGLDPPSPFRVSVLSDPTRIVVDVARRAGT